MACATVATVSVAAPVAAQIGESRVLSSQSIVLSAPKRTISNKLVCNKSRVVMSAAPRKEVDMAGLTSIALVAAAIIPEVAEAAAPGVSPSLKNLLLSVVAGGVVLAVLGVAVAGVATFDPVKRR
jgi:Sec-independent protein secretion pathway component TatC